MGHDFRILFKNPKTIFKLIGSLLMSFSSHFRFSLVLADKVMKMFIYISKSLDPLQMETIVKKSTQPKSPKMKNKITKICNKPGMFLWLELVLLLVQFFWINELFCGLIFIHKREKTNCIIKFCQKTKLIK